MPVKDLCYSSVVETVLKGHEIVVAEQSICSLIFWSSYNNKVEMPGIFPSKNADKRSVEGMSCNVDEKERRRELEEEARSIFCDLAMHLSVTAGSRQLGDAHTLRTRSEVPL